MPSAPFFSFFEHARKRRVSEGAAAMRLLDSLLVNEATHMEYGMFKTMGAASGKASWERIPHALQ
jgi:hypothetical protein